MPQSKKKPALVPSPDSPKETKEQKLIRLSDARVTKACKYISLIGNLAAYKPTSADVDSIMSALGGACAQIESRLRGGVKEVIAFSLRTHNST